MIKIKTEKEVQVMAEGGKILSEALSQVIKNIRPGVSEKDLDKIAEREILKVGAFPGFKKIKNYNNAICVSTNSVVVHGIPTDYKLKEGDVIGIDCGVFYKGFHTDMAHTVRVQNQNSKIKNKKEEIGRFLKTGERVLWEAIKVARAGNRVGDISKTIQDIVEKENGYSVVRSLVGHGVGRQLHEEPEIPGFLGLPIEETAKLLEGMTIAIEVIYNMGKKEVALSKDGWTIRTKDKSISGVFEKTIAITSGAPLILTQ